MHNKKILARAATLLATASLFAGANANAWYSYSATACKFYGVQANDTMLTYQGGTRITNTSGSDVKVACPIVRTNPTANAGGVVDGSNTAGWNVSDCNFFVSAFDGATFQALPSPQLSLVGQAQQFLWNTASISSAYNYGNLSFVCFIPPGGTILDYQVNES